MNSTPTLGFDHSDGLLLLYLSPEHPSDEDWNAYLGCIATVIREVRGTLVVSDGGSPNSAQRSQMAKVAGARRVVPVAVVTASPIVRGAVTATRWLGFANARAFRPDELRPALEFLEFSDRSTAVEQLVHVLRAGAGDAV